MPRNIRFGIFVIYTAVAVLAPLMAYLFPGEPALKLNTDLIQVEGNTLPEPSTVLNAGAENYQHDVLHDLDGHVDSVAADYPDGSSALLARFEKPFFAEKAEATLKKMMPHKKEEEKDLWSVYFESDSGEYVVLSRLDQFLVLIIADREELARERLETLPAYIFNPTPGIGAMLGQQSTGALLMLLLLYVFLQALLIANLKRWVAMADAEAKAPEKVEEKSPDA